MQRISYNETYGMQKAVFEGYKEMTRREPIFEDIQEPRTEFDTRGHLRLYDGDRLVHVSRYVVGEEVAIAQRYCDIANDPYFKYAADEMNVKRDIAMSKGWSNKMFVKALLMPRRQIITDIKAERLQDISEEDCLKEGIQEYFPYIDRNPNDKVRTFQYFKDGKIHHRISPASICFALLFDDINGKGTWERNPWVFAYGFELVK